MFVVVPVPYDLTSTYQPGSRRGPAAIIEASTNMELYDEELKKETYLAGIHTTLPLAIDARGPKNMINTVRKKIAKIVALNKIPVMLGGEHSISFGAVQALKEKYPKLKDIAIGCPCRLAGKLSGKPLQPRLCGEKNFGNMSSDSGGHQKHEQRRSGIFTAKQS